MASKLFLPAHWFVDQYRSHEGPAIREQEQRVADATGQAREIEKMVAGILAGPVRRVAYYSVVHAVYSGFEIGLLELCRAIAQKGGATEKVV